MPAGFRISRHDIDKFTKALDKEVQRSARRVVGQFEKVTGVTVRRGRGQRYLAIPR